MVSGLFKKIFGSRNQRLLKGYRKIVRKINQLEPQMQALNDDELRAKTDEFKQRYVDGASLDSLLPEAFAVVRDAALVADEVLSKALEADVMKLVDSRLGAVARPSRVIFVTALPKTRSGKLLRRALQAVAERRDPGDLATMEDPAALQQVKDLVG